MKFKDKVAIIAGSVRGLGKEIARGLASEGARFVTGEILDVNGGLPMD